MENGFLIDTHAHLDVPEDPVGESLKAMADGVRCMVGVSIGMASPRRILELAETLPDLILPALGLHPWNIDERSSSACLQEDSSVAQLKECPVLTFCRQSREHIEEAISIPCLCVWCISS